jgi:hypothetical protein
MSNTEVAQNYGNPDDVIAHAQWAIEDKIKMIKEEYKMLNLNAFKEVIKNKLENIEILLLRKSRISASHQKTLVNEQTVLNKLLDELIKEPGKWVPETETPIKISGAPTELVQTFAEASSVGTNYNNNNDKRRIIEDLKHFISNKEVLLAKQEFSDSAKAAIEAERKVLIEELIKYLPEMVYKPMFTPKTPTSILKKPPPTPTPKRRRPWRKKVQSGKYGKSKSKYLFGGRRTKRKRISKRKSKATRKRKSKATRNKTKRKRTLRKK